jgi:hypothetical protein
MKTVAPSLVPFTPAPTQQDLIAQLESLLERARSGELQALAFAGVLSNGNSISGWGGRSTTLRLMGSIAFLQARFAHAANIQFDEPFVDEPA